MRDAWITVRARHNRALDHDEYSYLRPKLDAQPVIATYSLDVRAQRNQTKNGGRPSRRARRALMELRVANVSLRLRHGKREKDVNVVEMNAVIAREVTDRSDAIEWLLLTTHPVCSAKDALAVIHGYAQRWRVEVLHRTWKRGLCRVEETQLRSAQAVVKWATILLAVATRAMRLSQLARTKPAAPATDELTPEEIDATIVLREPKGIKRGYQPTLAQAVRWIADIGGYTGKSSGGPPGPTVIGRGLLDVLIAVRAFENAKKLR